MITIETLKRMPSGNRACSAAQEWFMETFPDGAAIHDVWNACNKDEWRVWFTVNFVEPTITAGLIAEFIDNGPTVISASAYLAAVLAGDADTYADDDAADRALRDLLADTNYPITYATDAYGIAAYTADDTATVAANTAGSDAADSDAAYNDAYAAIWKDMAEMCKKVLFS